MTRVLETFTLRARSIEHPEWGLANSLHAFRCAQFARNHCEPVADPDRVERPLCWTCIERLIGEA